MAYIKKSDRKPTAKNMTVYFIKQFYFNRPRYEVIIPNCYPTSKGTIYGFSWKELDICAVRKSGYIEEIECKISLHDLTKLEPLKTIHKGSKEILKHDALLSGDCLPNYFSYLFPVGLVDYNTIPEQYGIYEFQFTSYTGQVLEVRKPKLLHRNKDKSIVDAVKEKGYIRYINSVIKE